MYWSQSRDNIYNYYYMQSKSPTTIVHLKPRDSKFSKHDRSTMQNESIKVDETALETGSPKSYIAGLLENEEKWQKV